MSNKNSKSIIFMLIIFALLTPIIVLIIFHISAIFPTESKSLGIGDTINGLNQLLCFIPTFVISIIAVLQNQKLNKLESHKYSFFIAVKAINEKLSVGDNFILRKENTNTNLMADTEFNINYIIGDEEVVYLADINLVGINENSCIRLIPLSIITKNMLLITKIDFTRIKFTINYYNKNNEKETLEESVVGNHSSIFGIYENDSIIPLVLGMTLPQSENKTYNIDAEMTVAVEDQYSNSYKSKLVYTIDLEGNNTYLIKSIALPER